MPDKYIVRVWDLPTRLFHWALAICTVGAIVTAQVGGAMDWHLRFGYSVCTLLLFRLVWGLVGGHWSRFSSFLYRPSQIMAYLKGREHQRFGIGHNPLGALSVFAMLGALALQLGTGLFSSDEVSVDGPLVQFVASKWVDQATHYHTVIGKIIILALLAGHVLAIILYLLVKRENLLHPMLSGDKKLAQAANSSQDDARSRSKAAVILAVCAAIVWALVAWLG